MTCTTGGGASLYHLSVFGAKSALSDAPGVVLCICSVVITFPYFPNCLPALGHCRPLIFSSSNCAFQFLLSFVLHAPQPWTVYWVCINVLWVALLQETFANNLFVEYFCVIFISPLLYTVITQLHHGRFVPQGSLFRWAHVLLTYLLHSANGIGVPWLRRDSK